LERVVTGLLGLNRRDQLKRAGLESWRRCSPVSVAMICRSVVNARQNAAHHRQRVRLDLASVATAHSINRFRPRISNHQAVPVCGS
jgi:hypothetical protein